MFSFLPVQVLSVTLDDWSEDEIEAMIEVGGNTSANEIYEAFLPQGVSKPGPNASHEQRTNFIRLCKSWNFSYCYRSICVCYDPSVRNPFVCVMILVLGMGLESHID